MLRPKEVWTKDDNLEYRPREKADDEVVHTDIKQEQRQGPRKRCQKQNHSHVQPAVCDAMSQTDIQ